MEVINNFKDAFVESVRVLAQQRPANLHAGGIEEIKRIVPNAPGIYAIFRKGGQECFYVGSAVNSIRDRLLMHYGKDAKTNYRQQLGVLQNMENFRFWFYEIVNPPTLDRLGFKCLIPVLEAMCSAAWNPEVQSKKF